MEPETHAAASGACREVVTIPLEFLTYADSQREQEHAEPVRDRWIYVFKRYGWGTSLYAEIFIDENGTKKLVNWHNQHWEGADERPATVERETFEVSYQPEQYTIVLFLSHVQLARERIEAYTGRSGRARVSRRGLPLDVDESDHVTPMGDDCAGCRIYLTDHLHIVQQLHARYREALDEYAEFISDDEAVSRQLLATLTLNVAERVADDDSDVWSWLDENGNALRREVRRYSTRRQQRKNTMDTWSRALTSWMLSSTYQELLHDYTGTDVLEDQGYDLQADLCEGLCQSAPGRNYLDHVLQDRDSWHNQYVVPAGPNLLGVADKTVGAVDAALKFIQEFAGGLARRSMQQAVSFVYLSFQMRFDLTISLHTLLPGGGGSLVWQEMTYTRFVEAHVIGVRIDVEAVEQAVRAGRLRHAAEVRQVGVSRVIAVINIVNLVLAGKGLAEARTGRQQAMAVIALTGAVADTTAALAGLMRQTSGVQFVGTTASIAGGVLTYAGAIPEIASNSYEGNWGLVAGWSAVALGGTFATASAAVGSGAAFGLAAGPLGLIAAAFALGGVALIWAFTESPLEEWFRQCPWGEEPAGRSVRNDLEDLLGLIGQPRLRLQRVGDNRLQITLEPSFAMPGQTQFNVRVTVNRVTYRREVTNYAYHDIRTGSERVATIRETFEVRAEADMARMERTASVTGTLTSSTSGLERVEVTYDGTLTAQFLEDMEEETYDVEGTIES